MLCPALRATNNRNASTGLERLQHTPRGVALALTIPQGTGAASIAASGFAVPDLF